MEAHKYQLYAYCIFDLNRAQKGKKNQHSKAKCISALLQTETEQLDALLLSRSCEKIFERTKAEIISGLNFLFSFHCKERENYPANTGSGLIPHLPSFSYLQQQYLHKLRQNFLQQTSKFQIKPHISWGKGGKDRGLKEKNL